MVLFLECGSGVAGWWTQDSHGKEQGDGGLGLRYEFFVATRRDILSAWLSTSVFNSRSINGFQS